MAGPSPSAATQRGIDEATSPRRRWQRARGGFSPRERGEEQSVWAAFGTACRFPSSSGRGSSVPAAASRRSGRTHGDVRKYTTDSAASPPMRTIIEAACVMTVGPVVGETSAAAREIGAAKTRFRRSFAYRRGKVGETPRQGRKETFELFRGRLFRGRFVFIPFAPNAVRHSCSGRHPDLPGLCHPALRQPGPGRFAGRSTTNFLLPAAPW
jgi:hypothetical protein